MRSANEGRRYIVKSSPIGYTHTQNGPCFDNKINIPVWIYSSVLEGGVPTSIRSSDNDSTSFWPPGSLHTRGADGHI